MVRHRALGISLGLAGIGMHGLAWTLVAAGRPGWGTWFYQVAWWTYIAAVGGFLVAAGRTHVVQRVHPAMLPWSVVWWVIFDIYGLRLRNWYYVMAPSTTVIRWIGFWTAFATVIPLTVVTEGALDTLGLFRDTASRGFVITPRLRRTLRAAGVLCFVLPLAVPRYCFPLTWLFAPLLIESWLAGTGTQCLLAELSNGRPGKVLRLLATGLVVGILWELFNHGASSRWIYTVPGLAEGKLFEMPLPGFLGFPPFAVATYSFWTMVAASLGVSPHGGAHSRPRRARILMVSFLATLPLCVAGFAAIDRGTVRSFLPVVQDLPGWEPGMGAREQQARVVCARGRHAAVPEPLRERWCRVLTMAEHRGMGLTRALQLEALGFTVPADLTGSHVDTLLRQWPSPDPPRREEVAIWVAAAPGDGSR